MRVFKILTNNRTEISSYIFNEVKQHWEYFSKRRRIWKKDLKNSKFVKFLKNNILPILKTVATEILVKAPFITELIKMLLGKNLQKLIQDLLIRLVPLLTMAGTTL